MMLGNWTSTCKRMTLDPYLTLYPKIKSIWIKDQEVRPKIMLLEETLGIRFHDLGLGRDFLDMMPKAQATEGKTGKSMKIF